MSRVRRSDNREGLGRAWFRRSRCGGEAPGGRRRACGLGAGGVFPTRRSFRLSCDLAQSGAVRSRRHAGLSRPCPIHAVPGSHPVKGRRSRCGGVRCGAQPELARASKTLTGVAQWRNTQQARVSSRVPMERADAPGAGGSRILAARLPPVISPSLASQPRLTPSRRMSAEVGSQRWRLPWNDF